MALHLTEHNEPYYTELPSIFRLATIEDFYYNSLLIMNKPYLIHSEIEPGRYWGKRTKEDFMGYNDFYTFLARNRIYVLREICPNESVI